MSRCLKHLLHNVLRYWVGFKPAEAPPVLDEFQKIVITHRNLLSRSGIASLCRGIVTARMLTLHPIVAGRSVGVSPRFLNFTNNNFAPTLCTKPGTINTVRGVLEQLVNSSKPVSLMSMDNMRVVCSEAPAPALHLPRGCTEKLVIENGQRITSEGH